MGKDCKWRRRKRAQYDDVSGDLVYTVGFSGNGGSIEDDMGGSVRPKNVAEGQCFDILRESGWKPTKRGWPDFLCVRGNEVCAVEVKRSKRQILKQNQLTIMGILSAAGVRCFLWSPDGGFEEVMGKKSNQIEYPD